MAESTASNSNTNPQLKSIRPLTPDEVATFQNDGVLIIRDMFTQDEISALTTTARSDPILESYSYGKKDASGRSSKLCLWNHAPLDSIYGSFSRSSRITSAVELLLSSTSIYHYHSKLMLKEAKIGGKWEWHQDYGYWYQNGCLFPTMLSVMIALDPATKLNGCLQVIKGSQKLGRIEHVLTGEQAGAEKGRVDDVLKSGVLGGIEYCEMKPGDVMFMHSNILHTSSANESEFARWTLICCYNTKENNPVRESHHPRYSELKKADDGEIMRMKGVGFREESVEKYGFLKPEMDKSADSLSGKNGNQNVGLAP
eukprot:TRINITY_DN3713_c0_g1_i1.p1 TRINITY_DN3713_c0_g1~~TRINITY_DN3713_c0_g1_i1.p1  ORF type:complete len:312 (+),score=76.80 TRINITY_DN3713_c0_g1_i1:57-992(+)